MKYFQLFLLTCALIKVNALSKYVQWYHQKVIAAMAGCLKLFKSQVPSNDLGELLAGEVPDGEGAKCLLACSYKKIGTLTTIGHYNTYHLLEVAYEFRRKHGNLSESGREKLLDDAVLMGDKCWNVNQAILSEGSKGCERAALLLKCFQKNNDKMLERNFKMNYVYNVERGKLLCLTESRDINYAGIYEIIANAVPKSKDSMCILACAYKFEGTMNKDGYYDPHHLTKIAKEYMTIHKFTAHERNLLQKHAAEMDKRCEKVNDEKVSDEKKGCERASLISKCRQENGKADFAGLGYH